MLRIHLILLGALLLGSFQNPFHLNAQPIGSNIAIDNNTLHRVRVGPLSDMNRLDQVRSTLKQHDIPFMLLREKG